MGEAQPLPRVAEHKARNDYPCDDPDNRGCRRTIVKGDIYVQLSWPPHSRPFLSPLWTIVRACSACRLPETATSTTCPIGPAGMTCLADAGHGPDVEHIYQEALF
jgi:hypothetical protein